MKISSVGDLEEILKKIKDKSLPIRLIDSSLPDEENNWAHTLEISNKGQSGYEVEGEVRLIAN